MLERERRSCRVRSPSFASEASSSVKLVGRRERVGRAVGVLHCSFIGEQCKAYALRVKRQNHLAL